MGGHVDGSTVGVVSRPRATLALGAAILCWASIPLFLKYFSSLLDAWTLNAYRYTVAAAVYLPFLLSRAGRGRVPKGLWKWALVPTFFNIVSQNLWTWAPYFINPGLMSFLARGSIVWSVIGSFVIFPDERPAIKSPRFAVGLTVAAAGYGALMVQQGGLSHGPSMVGVVIMVSCGLFTAGYGLTVRRFLRAADPRLAFAIIALYTAASANVLMALLGHPQRLAALDLSTALLMALSALLGLAIAQVAYYMAVARLGVAICSSSMLMTSFLTILASGQLFGERFSLGQWVAGSLLIAGGVLVIRSARQVEAWRSRAA
ncbi:MAG: DMT family transporter [candidate division KSB1 bacterium]|nr:DMT family transporter [candidate division KSB1 bacterium]